MGFNGVKWKILACFNGVLRWFKLLRAFMASSIMISTGFWVFMGLNQVLVVLLYGLNGLI